MADIIKSYFSQSYLLTKAIHYWRLKAQSSKSKAPIVIFQMGKVGSTAILDGLHELAPQSPVFHVHFLSGNGILDAKQRLESLGGKRRNANAWCLYESEFVNRLFDKHPTRQIYIITLVRDPVARNVSSFFYNIQKYMPGFYHRFQNGELSIDSIRSEFLERFPEHRFPLDWFDAEMKPVFGVDIYGHTFPKGAGFSVIEEGNIKLLTLKLEKFEICIDKAFHAFLGFEKFPLKKANTSEEQGYSSVYKRFRAEVELPESYLNMMYRSRFAQHFYSQEEIDQFRRNWER